LLGVSLRSCYASGVSDAAAPQNPTLSRHAAFVRATHWITALCFFALLVSGLEIVVSHPRFYWGETGNSGTTPLFKIPIPSSRSTVPTGYGYVLPDQNGWSRYLHFQAAWAAVLTGLAYLVWGLWTGHFRSNLMPGRAERSWRAIVDVMASHLRLRPPDGGEDASYNVLQKTAYLVVVFVLFPLMIWTGLALSPGFNAAFPAGVNLLGGRQSARTLHLSVTIALVLFLVIHLAMVALSGFRSRMRGMITGAVSAQGERS